MVYETLLRSLSRDSWAGKKNSFSFFRILYNSLFFHTSWKIETFLVTWGQRHAPRMSKVPGFREPAMWSRWKREPTNWKGKTFTAMETTQNLLEEATSENRWLHPWNCTTSVGNFNANTPMKHLVRVYGVWTATFDRAHMREQYRTTWHQTVWRVAALVSRSTMWAECLRQCGSRLAVSLGLNIGIYWWTIEISTWFWFHPSSRFLVTFPYIQGLDPQVKDCDLQVYLANLWSPVSYFDEMWITLNSARFWHVSTCSSNASNGFLGLGQERTALTYVRQIDSTWLGRHTYTY